jgi:hypothetical protein
MPSTELMKIKIEDVIIIEVNVIKPMIEDCAGRRVTGAFIGGRSDGITPDSVR